MNMMMPAMLKDRCKQYRWAARPTVQQMTRARRQLASWRFAWTITFGLLLIAVVVIKGMLVWR